MVREGREPAPVVGVGDEELDVGVVPGGGVQVVDRALAQVEVLREGGSAGWEASQARASPRSWTSSQPVKERSRP